MNESLTTLADLIPAMKRLGRREAVRFDDGFRTVILSYADLLHSIGCFQSRLRARGLQPGNRVVLWAENCPEWIATFWACVLLGVEVVPLDSRSPQGQVGKVSRQVHADLLLYGSEQDPEGLPQAQPLGFGSGHTDPAMEDLASVVLSPEQTVQVLFTSGTTGRPEGVVHSHRNICANLEPFRRELNRYRLLAWPFQPIRLLNLLPLSHMFGQAVGLFIPVLLGGSVVLTSRRSPRAVVETIRRHSVSVACLVPRMLSGLRHELVSQEEGLSPEGNGPGSVIRRWWRHRHLHRKFGLKFWAFVVGGAAVDRRLEEFWRRRGFAVVQGYGLTESSPVVTVNHPLRSVSGALGQPVAGQQIKLAPDGEILVRGPSVARRRVTESGEVEDILDDGWLHTGDIGRFDDEGRLFFLGRKKDLIISSSGLNVYPEDVEAALNDQPGIRESVVVPARAAEGEERVHAVLLLEDSAASPAEAVRAANARLQDYQRIRSWSLWPGQDFPRTLSTGKVQRHQVAKDVEQGADVPDRREAPSRAPLGGLDGWQDDSRLDEDLGLTSLDRIEMLEQLEDEYQISLNEGDFSAAETVGDVQELVRQAQAGRSVSPPQQLATRLPRVAQLWPFRVLRWGFLNLVMTPLFRGLMELEIEGLERWTELEPPLLFAANHSSHLDAAAVLAAMPRKWRGHICPAARQEYFEPYWQPNSPLVDRVKGGVLLSLACFLFNVFPLPQRGGQIGATLSYAGRRADEQFSILIFPEGRRTRTGKMMEFRAGVGLLSLRLRIPIIPVAIRGTYESFAVGDSWPERGPVKVSFGDPIVAEPGEAPAQIAERVRRSIEQMLRT